MLPRDVSLLDRYTSDRSRFLCEIYSVKENMVRVVKTQRRDTDASRQHGGAIGENSNSFQIGRNSIVSNSFPFIYEPNGGSFGSHDVR